MSLAQFAAKLNAVVAQREGQPAAKQTVLQRIGIAHLAAINTALLGVITYSFKNLPAPYSFLLGGGMLVFTCIVNSIVVVRHLTDGHRRSWLWWLFFLFALACLVIYFRPDVIAKWVLPGMTWRRVEEQAARLQVVRYLSDINTILALQREETPTQREIDAVERALALLTPDRASANLRGYGVEGSIEGRLVSWNDIEDTEQAEEFVRRFRDGYKDSQRLDIMSIVVEPVYPNSADYAQGVRYYGYATIAYIGTYLLEGAEVTSLNVEGLVRGLRERESAERQSISTFLHRAFDPMTDDLVEQVCQELLKGKLADLRNDDKWEEAYARVMPTGVVRPDSLKPAREQIMVKYPLAHLGRGETWLDRLRENPWRIGQSSERLLTRIPIE